MNSPEAPRWRPTSVSMRAAALALILLGFTGCDMASCASGSGGDAPPAAPETVAVEIADRTFELELALDRAARYQGLSDRASIAADGGMLFAFPEPEPLTFVMRRCLVPIDVIFLDPGGRIVAMHAMEIEPYDTPERSLRRYGSRWPAQFAIELRGGMIETLGLEEGQRIDLPLQHLKQRAK